MENGIVQEDKTIISNNVSIEGDITAVGNMIINGTIKGNVNIDDSDLFLGPGGKIEGDVHAQNVRIRGHMKGEIKATGKVEITKEADFSGKIKGKSISVEEGAYLDASVDMGRKSPGTGDLIEIPTDKVLAGKVLTEKVSTEKTPTNLD